jgi:hypothetical protein
MAFGLLTSPSLLSVCGVFLHPSNKRKTSHGELGAAQTPDRPVFTRVIGPILKEDGQRLTSRRIVRNLPVVPQRSFLEINVTAVQQNGHTAFFFRGLQDLVGIVSLYPVR